MQQIPKILRMMSSLLAITPCLMAIKDGGEELYHQLHSGKIMDLVVFVRLSACTLNAEFADLFDL